jgi:hypothetical protein
MSTDGESFVAYCYVVDVNGSNSMGSTWFQSAPPHYFDFVCEANDGVHSYQPTPDGHPTSPLAYPMNQAGFTTSHAIFVGSVVVTNVLGSACGSNTGSGYGTSVIPFYRNGSQVIYDTATTCAITYAQDAGENPDAGCGGEGSMQTTWDLGIPSGGIRSTFIANPVPQEFGIDFTRDGLNDVFPLSASKVILDTQAHSDNGEISTTLCYLDPNNHAVDDGGLRSCQSELMLDSPSISPEDVFFMPYYPFRTSLNLGLGSGSQYGEFWVAGLAIPSATSGGQTYFDLSYRGYVEPERQLVPNATIPMGR